MRNLDRLAHMETYPELAFPNMFLLKGGYKAFFELYSASHLQILCTNLTPWFVVVQLFFSACSNFAWIGILFWYTTLDRESQRERIHQVGKLFSDLSNLKQSHGALSNSWRPICTDLCLNVFSLAHNWTFQICVFVTLIFLYHVQELCVPREYVKMSDPKSRCSFSLCCLITIETYCSVLISMLTSDDKLWLPISVKI
jgi:hypothetical protein